VTMLPLAEMTPTRPMMLAHDPKELVTRPVAEAWHEAERLPRAEVAWRGASDMDRGGIEEGGAYRLGSCGGSEGGDEESEHGGVEAVVGGRRVPTGSVDRKVIKVMPQFVDYQI
jgi:hypothetical protein